jgi:hypothetical protein
MVMNNHYDVASAVIDKQIAIEMEKERPRLSLLLLEIDEDMLPPGLSKEQVLDNILRAAVLLKITANASMN